MKLFKATPLEVELPPQEFIPHAKDKEEEEQRVYKPEGTKHDACKIRLELLPIAALEEVGKVLTFGAQKYAPDNWRKGFEYRRLIGAILRHVYSFARGQDLDPETGISHLAHAACMVLFLLTHQLQKLGVDDRIKE
jgi:hypothetical protein